MIFPGYKMSVFLEYHINLSIGSLWLIFNFQRASRGDFKKQFYKLKITITEYIWPQWLLAIANQAFDKPVLYWIFSAN